MKKNIVKFCAMFAAAALIFGSMPVYAKKAKSATEESDKKNEKPPKPKKIKKVKYNDEKYRNNIITGKYDTALGMLVGLKKKTIAQQMDLALLQHYTGDYAAAAATMEEASKNMGDMFASYLKSDGTQKVGGGAILSEKATPYRGNIYEYLLVDAFNALNYYKLGQIENANSCVVRVGDKQKEYAGKYHFLLEDEEIGELIGEDGKKIEKPNTSGFLPAKPTEECIYKTSAFADYLQIVLGAQNGNEIDDYIIRELNIIAPDVETVSAELPREKGRIEVLALTGKIAQKVEHVEIVPSPFTIVFGSAGNFKFVWPEYKGNKAPVPKVKNVKLSNGESTAVVLLEDFDKDVENNVKLNARRAANRSIARMTLTKTITASAAIAGIAAADNEDNEFAKSMIILTTIGVLKGIDAKEAADLRQSMALPSKAYCAGFTVDPGNYTVTVEYDNGTTETIENVEVKAGKPVLVESICK